MKKKQEQPKRKYTMSKKALEARKRGAEATRKRHSKPTYIKISARVDGCIMRWAVREYGSIDNALHRLYMVEAK